MKKILLAFFAGASFLLLANGPLMAGGELLRLKSIADSMALQEKELKQEEANYQKAEAFLNSPDIKKGLSQDFILERCGEPVVRIRDDSEWVYKPSSSTFFKGEKVYLIFDKERKLTDWEKVRLE